MERSPAGCVFLTQQPEYERMMSRPLLAALIAAATAGAAVADVQVNTPGAKVEAPSGPVDLNVSVAPKAAPTEAWVGRTVYSSDGMNLGEIGAVTGDQIYADLGGFLGIGETRVLLTPDEIAAVSIDRIDLKLTKAEADKLPSVDEKPAIAK